MFKLPRACAALGLTLLAATALGAAGLTPAALAHTPTPVGQRVVVQADGVGHDAEPEVNNTGSSFDPREKM
ncbi:MULTISPECIES: hypothetical protein [Streptomyces]|uniref:hypothetical protein n=1 Tax=Streptomyces TaxID=1883 RepID=UPI00017E91D8|nr:MULTISPECIES: hypothetical protein [Streptomyces]AKL70757.1 hypothetical protein M444_35875 [Streptomyces sp. Mg1]EDX24273.1 hypothetical protein SSAG_04064 [Streptomyces sp. Mg1]WBY24560.1 hypothetical protein PET44_33345 [Streptomyces goshikiensis]WSS03669.1 hypothetical protein OG224_37010 [Streptomyces goshikiensis]WSY02779.1 hypothetical protein OG590_36760 [Streptomyces goshikiensis]